MRRTPSVPPVRRALALAASAALLGTAAQAQTPAPDPAPAADDALQLQRVLVTGTSNAASRMKQSLSSSTLDLEQILRQSPANAAEILRSIPGIRSESSGGEGNANLTVRGAPISAGGARYVQIQEDGLPVLLFGDIAFGTADQFLRADYSLDRLEVVRGGSASTLASNSPGGIVNFISRDGREPGGAVGLTLGVHGGRQVRLDANYGVRLGSDTLLHIGGFQRVGEGDRPTDFNAAKGGQIKASLRQNLGRDAYVRATVKALDDRTPTFLPVPTYLSGSEIRQVPGIDPRTAFFIGRSFTSDATFNKDGGTTTSDPRDGLRVRSTAFGLEAEAKLGAVTLSDKFRVAQNRGRFIGLFPSDNGGASDTVTPATFTGVLFNTAINSLDNTFNDLKASMVLAQNGRDRTTLAGGVFYGKQTVALTWFWNRYTMQRVNTGSTATFLGPGWDTFGGCCVRDYDVDYTTVAPYLALTSDFGPLSVDVSVRRDRQRASGFYREDDPITRTWAPATRVNYSVSHTSYSAGLNFQVSSDLALFGRASDGVAFSADRLLYGNPLDGSVPVAINELKQLELGAKLRSGPFSAFLTLFNARTSESNYEATTQQFTANRYRARGAELEVGVRAGDFRLTGGATVTDAKITASNTPSQVGNTPRRQARWVWQLAPSYVAGPFEVGAALIGTARSWGNDDNTINMPGYTVVNAFATWHATERLDVFASVNNLANTVGWTEVEGDGHAARSINGRTVRLGLKYSF